MTHKFKVQFIIELPEQHRDYEYQNIGPVLCKDVKEHVREAVQAWGGQKHPSDVFFGLDEKAITKMKVYNV